MQRECEHVISNVTDTECLSKDARAAREVALRNVLHAAEAVCESVVNKQVIVYQELTPHDIDTVRDTDPNDGKSNCKDKLLARILGPKCAASVEEQLETVTSVAWQHNPADVFLKILCCDSQPVWRYNIGRRRRENEDKTMLMAVSARSIVTKRMGCGALTADEVFPTTLMYIFCGHCVPFGLADAKYSNRPAQWPQWALNMVQIVAKWKEVHGGCHDNDSHTRSLLIAETIAHTHAHGDVKAAELHLMYRLRNLQCV
jgi:hypothetical protein